MLSHDRACNDTPGTSRKKRKEENSEKRVSRDKNALASYPVGSDAMAFLTIIY
jgi:hypothetical protein